MAATAAQARQQVGLRLGSLVRGEIVLFLIALVVGGWLLLPAIGATFVQAFRVPTDDLFIEASSSWSVGNFPIIYTSSRGLQSTLLDTGIFVFGSVALAFTLGFTIAWFIERTDTPFRNVLFALLLFPLMMPAIVTTLGWIFLLGNRVGLINIVVRTVLNWLLPGEALDFGAGPFNLTTMYGMVVVQGFGQVTLFVILIGAALRSMDPSLEEASRVSGARFLQTLQKVTIPILRPSVLGAVILAGIFTLESFEVPLMLATGAKADILSTRVWELLETGSGEEPAYGAVAAMGLHFMLITYLLFYAYSVYTRRAERFATMTGKGFRSKRYELGRWRWPSFVGLGLFLAFISLTPFLILIYTSLLPAYRPPSWDVFPEAFSLTGYRELLFDNSRIYSAITNTVIIALLAPTISVLVALVIAWTVVRGRIAPRARLAMDLFTSSSLAIPAVVAAFAFFIFYISLNQALNETFLGWIPLARSLLVLVIVYSYRMALAYRFQRAGIAQIAKELEEASSTSGGSAFTTLRRILLPLVIPYTMGAWIILFLLAFREFTLAQVITSGTDPWVISTLVFNLRGTQGDQAAALSVLTVVFLFAVLIFVRVVGLRRIRSF